MKYLLLSLVLFTSAAFAGSEVLVKKVYVIDGKETVVLENLTAPAREALEEVRELVKEIKKENKDVKKGS